MIDQMKGQFAIVTSPSVYPVLRAFHGLYDVSDMRLICSERFSLENSGKIWKNWQFF